MRAKQRRRQSPVKQVTIDAFIGSEDGRVREDVQFKVPFLPLTAPRAPTPSVFREETPLYAHQERSLHRMLQIEAQEDAVSRFQMGVHEYYSKGGCLADAIGTGKTASMLALLVSEPINATMGANLLLAPSHLLVQWESEVHKFLQPGALQVVLGLRRYLAMDSAQITNRTLVLVGVEEAIASQAHHYHFRKLYPRAVGHAGHPMSVDSEALASYTTAAKYVSNAYSGLVWVSKLHFPDKPWRRVIFEEVQDLVLPGKQSQDCFIQLTRSAANVWLITATPFPAKADSIYANNQLLGFKRLRLLPHDPLFDALKKKLYLRNCAQVKQEAITNKIRVRETYLSVALHPRELLLCKIEQVLAASAHDATALDLVDDGSGRGGSQASNNNHENSTIGRGRGRGARKRSASAMTTTKAAEEEVTTDPSSLWHEAYHSARQSCVHVGISERVLLRDHDHDPAAANAVAMGTAAPRVSAPHEVYKNEHYFLDRQLAVAQRRKLEVDKMEAATRNTVQICQAIKDQVYWTVRECFADKRSSGLARFFDTHNGETSAGFRMLSQHGRWNNNFPPEPLDLLMYDEVEIETYLAKYWDSQTLIARLLAIMESTLQERCGRARVLAADRLQQVQECITLKQQAERAEGEAQEAETAAGQAMQLAHGNSTVNGVEQEGAEGGDDDDDDQPMEAPLRVTRSGRHTSLVMLRGPRMPAYGSKIAHLITYLQRERDDLRVVLFSMWPTALRVVEQALRLVGIPCAVFRAHQSSETKSAHVASFQRGETQVLLLHALTSASGINLQVASHVIFLDPVGHTAAQASALEQQAIGRVLRMGQQHDEVTVVRLVAEQTLEATLFDEIHAANQRAAADEDAFFDGRQRVVTDADNSSAIGASPGSDGGAYVCLDFAAPIRKVVRLEVRPQELARVMAEAAADAPVDEEIAMVGTMSLSDVINQRMVQAAKHGNVCDLTADVDEDEDEMKAGGGDEEDTETDEDLVGSMPAMVPVEELDSEPNDHEEIHADSGGVRIPAPTSDSQRSGDDVVRIKSELVRPAAMKREPLR